MPQGRKQGQYCSLAKVKGKARHCLGQAHRRIYLIGVHVMIRVPLESEANTVIHSISA